jgi:hypothetical protein
MVVGALHSVRRQGLVWLKGHSVRCDVLTDASLRHVMPCCFRALVKLAAP